MSTSLGLAPGRVALQAHSEGWPAAFAAERARLASLLGEHVGGIEHVGSTAVPGLAAKPIIDIAVKTTLDSTFATVEKILLDNGYVYLLNARDEGGHIFALEAADGARTHHLHLIDETDVQWQNYLTFRNRLLNDAKLRLEYEKCKIALAARFATDRQAYTLAKADFVRRVLSGDRR